MAKLISETQKYYIPGGAEINFISQPFDNEELFLVGIYCVLANTKIKLTNTDVAKEILGGNCNKFQTIEDNIIVSESEAITMSNRFNVAMRSGKYDDELLKEVLL